MLALGSTEDAVALDAASMGGNRIGRMEFIRVVHVRGL